jgi:hypothetical protein
MAKDMAHPNMHVTFAHLRDVLGNKFGWTVRMNIFDCGHYVEVEGEDRRRVIARTWRCDDTAQDASSQIAQWLVDTGRMRVADFDVN